MAERRLHDRYPHQLRVRCMNPDMAFDSLTGDICAGGVFVITSHRLPLDSSIDLEISFGADEPVIHCRGRIAWINAGQVETFPPGFGVEFRKEDEQVMGRLLHELNY